MQIKRGSVVVLVAILVVSVVILAVLAYKSGFLGNFYGSDKGQAAQQVEPSEEAQIEDRSSQITDVSKDDEVGAIEKDLNNTDLNSLDQEVLGAKTEASSL